MKKILGLDLGVASLGWAVNIFDENKNQWYIDDFGVRLWNSSENSRKLVSQASIRRSYRSQRRIIRRKQQRINDIKNIFIKNNLLKKEEIENHLKKLTEKNNEYSSENKDLNPLFLREKGLNSKLTILQLFIVTYNISKRRGYENLFSIEEEERLNSTKKLIEKYKYPIVVINNEYNGVYRNREKSKREKFLFLRSDYKNEFKKILLTQVENNLIDNQIKKQLIEVVFRQRFFEEGPGPNLKKFEKKEFKEKLLSQGQNYYPTWHDAIGNCTFYKEEKRLTKNSIFSDLFIIYNELSKVTEKLNDLERKNIFNDVTDFYLKNIDFSKKIVSNIFLKHNLDFNFKNEGISFKKDNFFLVKLNKFNSKWVKEELSKIDFNVFNLKDNMILEVFGEILGNNVTPKKIIEELKKENLFFLFNNKNEEEIKDLITKQKFSSGRINVSKKYIKELIDEILNIGTNMGKYGDDFLKENLEKSIEKRLDLYSFDKKLTSKEALKLTFKPNINDLDMQRNSVVFRSINQTRLVIRALLKKYNFFDVVNYEVSKELYAASEVRRSIKNSQLKNEKQNEEIRRKLELLGSQYNTLRNIEKFKLWEQQKLNKTDDFAYDFYDINLNTKISLKEALSVDYEVDHILPYSIENDNTIWNKVLVSRDFNQKKGKRTPIDFFKNEYKNLDDIDKKIENWKKKIRTFPIFKGKQIKKESISRKINNLFLPSLTRNTESNFETKDLNDVRYISKYFGSYFKKEFKVYSKLINQNEPKINSIVGKVTSSFRKEWLKVSDSTGEINPWGLGEKVRELTPYHHGVDAIILSQFESFYQIQFLTFFVLLKNYFLFLKNKIKENRIEINKAINEMDETFNQLIKFGKNKNEKKYLYFSDDKKKILSDFNDELKSLLFNKKKINIDRISTYMKPPVDNLSDKVLNLIPYKLKVEEQIKEIKFIDENDQEKIFNKKIKVPIFSREVFPEEWSKLNNKKIDFFPWPSYKINGRIRGTVFKENQVSKKKALDLNNNLIDSKFYQDKNGNYWDKSEYYGVNLEKDNIKFINKVDIQNSSDKKFKKILIPSTTFKYNDRYFRFTGNGGSNRIIRPSIFNIYVGAEKYNKIFGEWPLLNLKEVEKIKIFNISILGKSHDFISKK